ncbi:LuxR C-terminal-related transcriptional regulator, partial [Klebsiella pneumoniae]|nr:LuxR C-terminal-related transcriptional regulator [Klebsiella pneumoniae]
IWLDPSIAKIVMQSLPNSPALPALGEGRERAAHTAKRRYNAELTEREQEVLKLIVSGKSNKEIAQSLSVSSHTAKAHVASIIQK